MHYLIWLMGASGAGKDSLLNGLRDQNVPELLVAHRYITRQASAGGENHIALSEDEFTRRHQHGLFALHWQAHGYRYGLGQEIDLWLQAGLHVVANGSRQHLPAALARYGARLLPVCVQVSPRVLRQRLENRGRESPAEIELRLARAARYPTADDHCLTLNNDGNLLQSVGALRQLIAGARTLLPGASDAQHY